MDIAHLPLAVDAAVKSSVVLGGTFAAAVFLRRASAATRHLAWTLGLGGPPGGPPRAGCGRRRGVARGGPGAP
jgi:hypothetical protein